MRCCPAMLAQNRPDHLRDFSLLSSACTCVLKASAQAFRKSGEVRWPPLGLGGSLGFPENICAVPSNRSGTKVSVAILECETVARR
jgi:hypothetical protein